MDIIYSWHAQKRMEERHISDLSIELCAKYGRKTGSYRQKILHAKDIPQDVLANMGKNDRKRLEKLLPICTVISEANMLVTTYRVLSNSKIRYTPAPRARGRYNPAA